MGAIEWCVAAPARRVQITDAMPSSRRLILALATAHVAPFALAHCMAPEENPVGTTETAHTEGVASAVNAPFLWIETDPTSFESEGSRFFGSGPPVPASDPVAARLQLWLDRFHEVAKRSALDKTGRELAAPRPIIQVRDDHRPNAWVSPLTGCAGEPVDLTHLAPASHGPPVHTALAIASRAGVRLTSAACVPAANWDLEGVAPFLTSLGGPCRFTRVDGAVVAQGSACAATPYSPHADRLGIEGASHFIQATTKLVAVLDDELALAFMLAHELAHYYRAHPTRLDAFDYWYEQHTPPRPGKPAPVADSDTYQRLYKKFGERPSSPPVEGEKTSPRLRTSLVQLGHALAGHAGLDPGCAALAPLLGGTWTSSLLRARTPLSEEERLAYLAFTSQLGACAATVRVSTSGAPGTILPTTSGIRSGGLPDAALADAPLALVLELLDARARVTTAEADAFRAEMNRRNLGHYTYEQEADDVAMELLAGAGYAPRRSAEAWLSLVLALHAEATTRSYFDDEPMPVADCAALFHAGWSRPGRNGAPEYVYVPLGKGRHHSFCYRLFNLSREMDAHAYVAPAAPSEPATPWATIRALAHARLAAPPPSPPPSPVVPPDGLPDGSPDTIFDPF